MAQSAEFILEPDQKQLLVLEPWGPSFELAIRSLSERRDLQVVECSTTTELIAVARQISYCVVLAFCAEESELERYKDLLKALEAEILAKKIRVIIGTLDRGDLKSSLLQAGASEVFNEPVGDRAVTSKIDYALSLLAPRKAAVRKTAGGSEKSSSNILWISALGLESDCWLSLRDEIKSVAGKWIIPMMGPSPRFGQWCPVSSEKWEWIPTQLVDDPFIVEEGAWIFKGECPEFRGGSWIFIGREPELAFVYKDESYGTKFSIDANTLVIAEDSSRARLLVSVNEKVAAAKANLPKADKTPERVTVEMKKPFYIVAPLDLQSDCFAREERVPRFMNGAWVMKFSGPTPVHGKWQLIKSDTLPIWQWTTSARDSFIKDQGNWIFQGQEPAYRDGLWTFVSEKPRLDFVTHLDPEMGRVLGRKILVDSRGAFLLAGDSEAALTALEKLLSFRKRPPGYLKRAKYGTKPPLVAKGLFADAPVHPVAAAFFVAELMRQKDETAETILKQYCAMLSRASGGGLVEPWILKGSHWKCLNHGDLMDMAMFQKIESTQPVLSGAEAGLQTPVIESSGARVVVTILGVEKLGILYFGGEKCLAFKEPELRAYARACAGIWLSMKAQPVSLTEEKAA